MKTENNYEKLAKIAAETSPLPKEEYDIPTRSITIDPDAPDEPIDKAQIEVEVDIEKNGVPIIEVERPPVPDVKTDPTPYKKVGVKRREKRSDKKMPSRDEVSLKEDREMMAYAEKLKIPKRKSIFVIIRKKLYELSCKISRIALNVQRKRFSRSCRHYHEDHILPENVKTMNLNDADEKKAEQLGRNREFKRNEDRSPNTIQMVRNKKTGVVVATPMISNYKDYLILKGEEISDYEIVESHIKR